MPKPPLFPLGRILATPGALDLGVNFYPFLYRHQRGDWGDLVAEDKAENDYSVKQGLRILSAYHTPDGIKFWIITEADRSVTTILLPQDY
jgi:hypothetical protein